MHVRILWSFWWYFLYVCYFFAATFIGCLNPLSFLRHLQLKIEGPLNIIELSFIFSTWLYYVIAIEIWVPLSSVILCSTHRFFFNEQTFSMKDCTSFMMRSYVSQRVQLSYTNFNDFLHSPLNLVVLDVMSFWTSHTSYAVSAPPSLADLIQYFNM